MKKYLKIIIIIAVLSIMSYSFWLSEGWMTLCAGLALFLFGMQCLEDGLRQIAGGHLERLLKQSTSTPLKGAIFGFGATTALQSSTLVSLLSIAFLSAGFIQLSAGISIIIGANLGASTGIWLLALVGQNITLSPVAMPLLFFGVLASFIGPKYKAVGRILLGIALIFIGIDDMKIGFANFHASFNFIELDATGWQEILLLCGIGVIATVILQSSHATLMLTLAALASGQLLFIQAAAIAIGANLGSSISTTIVAMLGSDRSGKRLVTAHAIFNIVTAIIALSSIFPLLWLVKNITYYICLGDNLLIQLALFNTLFNLIGVLLFWFWQQNLANFLTKIIPDQIMPESLIDEDKTSSAKTSKREQDKNKVQARYLNEMALTSPDTAFQALYNELHHLTRLCIEVICHSLYFQPDKLATRILTESELQLPEKILKLNVEELYQSHIKIVYGDCIDFIWHIQIKNIFKEEQTQELMDLQQSAYQLISAVKDSKHLQKNMYRYLQQPSPDIMHTGYSELRVYLIKIIYAINQLLAKEITDEEWEHSYLELNENVTQFNDNFRLYIFNAMKEQLLTGGQVSSLMNDIAYANNIFKSLKEPIMLLHEMLSVLIQQDLTDIEIENTDALKELD